MDCISSCCVKNCLIFLMLNKDDQKKFQLIINHDSKIVGSISRSKIQGVDFDLNDMMN